MLLVIVFGLLSLTTPALTAEDDGADWRPAATERLVKLPPAYLKKSLDRDFERSDLAEAMRRGGEDIDYKAATLNDLKQAVETASGDLNVELRHQYLAEKRAYIELVSRQHAQRKRYLARRQDVLEKLLRRAVDEDVPVAASRAELAAQQAAARARFAGTSDRVDLRVLRDQVAPESRYARTYADNLAAIERLTRAIDRHPMNADAAPVAAGDRRTLLRQMIADAEAERAIVEQEETILGFMAKLVALDAMGLAEEIAAGPDGETRPAAGPARPADALNHFVGG
ncbi:MAG: hypothetical protein RIM84_25870 [Alphaproteobacteria bacterium]